VQGCSQWDIADELQIDQSTVSRHQMSKTKEESSKIYSTKTPEDMSAVLLDESKY
jgi:predicted transcriptional regulator